MTAEWIEYKSKLLHSYFGANGVAEKDSSFYTEFLGFLAKYEARILNNPKLVRKFESYSDDVPSNSNGVPEGSYNKIHSVNIRLSDKIVDKFLLRDVPSIALQQFEYIITLYYKFRNGRAFKKLKTLKNNQKSLPIAANREEIINTIENNQVLIIAGDTGCGKSTQLPQYLLNEGFTKIACTQPRRIACTALAHRVSYEMLKQFDSEIAYQTRFDKTKSAGTRLLFLTEGVLLRQMVSDADLQLYNVIILDEVHERNITGDLLVALLKNLCYRRSDIKLVLMSATININLFKNYFPDAPLISVPGRLYPIELKYMPPLIRERDESKKSVKIDPGPYVNILQLIDKKYPAKERGDVLIFLNGISEISMVADACKEYAEFTKRWIILILHSTLSVEEQNLVFDVAPAGIRKCILSTNIAETSVTIDEVRFVVDSGKENMMRFDSSMGTHRLTESWISKASANQRKGRAGRTGPGVCFRLYSEQEYEKMEDFALPEIKRVSLDSLVIQILDMNLHIDVRDFAFIEPPDLATLNETLESLKSQGVIDARNEKTLTPLGMILAKLPVEVAISKMLIYACVLDQLDVMLTVAAGLSVQSPFTNRSFRDFECIQNRQYLVSDMGDPFTLLRVYREWIKLRVEGEDTRKWTRRCGIEETRLYEITKLRRQFREILEQNDLIPKYEEREWASMSSRERRIMVGEKRKLRELKKRAGFEGKKTKVLKEGQHFDTIMDTSHEEEAVVANPQEEINQLEFALVTGSKGFQRELTSHKLNETTATLVKMIISAALYPQYAMVDPSNSFRVGHDQFSHTPSKPFVVIHPNSSIGQIPEVLRIDIDSEGRSQYHQFIFYGLLLETTKPYLCNSSRIPTTFLLIFAKNIVCSSPVTLCCDGFVELRFLTEEDCEKVLEDAYEIRTLFLDSVESKLNSNEYGNYRHLEKKIVNFARIGCSFSIRRLINPSKTLRYGIFTASGDEHRLTAEEHRAETLMPPIGEEAEENDKLLDQELDEKKVDEKKLRGKEYFCQDCDRRLWFENNVAIIKHKKSHHTTSSD